jgi:hypothetical protein
MLGDYRAALKIFKKDNIIGEKGGTQIRTGE